MSVTELTRTTTERFPAMRVTCDNIASVAEWAGGVVGFGCVVVSGSVGFGPLGLRAFPGQWVIRRQDGFHFVRTLEELEREGFRCP